MTKRLLGRRDFGRLIPLTGMLGASACGGGGGGQSVVDPFAGMRPSGTVEFHEVQAAYMYGGSGGGGTLHFRGRRYPFVIAGAGIGGFGASTVDAYGEVYELRDVANFAGAYAQIRAGYAVGMASGGELLLRNGAGVGMRVRARREGLMLSLGADAMVISMR